MKYGVRKPSIKKSISARTTGKINRQVKKAVNPLYGKKGMGVINDPKKAAYNAVYDKTTVSAKDLVSFDDNLEYSRRNDDVSIFAVIVSFFKLLFAVISLLFWIAVLVGIIAFMVLVFKTFM